MSGDIFPLTLELCTKSNCLVSFTLRPFWNRGNSLSYHINRRGVEIERRFGIFGEKETLVHLTVINLRCLVRQISSLYRGADKSLARSIILIYHLILHVLVIVQNNNRCTKRVPKKCVSIFVRCNRTLRAQNLH